MAVTSTQTIIIGGRVQAPLALSRHLIVRGVVTMLVGLLVLLWPSAWLFTVTVVVGVASFVVGVVDLLDGAKRRRLGEDWVFEVGRGVLLLGLGLYLLAWPNLALDLLALVLGGCWLAYGAIEMFEGARARRGKREGRWRMLRGGAVGVLGIVLLAWPSITVTVLARVVGGLLVLSGLLCLVSARVLRDAGRNQRDVRLDVVS